MLDRQEREIVIENKVESMRAVHKQIGELLAAFDYSDHDCFQIKLSVEEALVNAIKHGNRMDPTKKVRVNYSIDSEQASFEIEDEGLGFSVKDIPNPTNGHGLTKPGGRGITLMRAFMCAVEYNEAGNRVMMRRMRQAAVVAGQSR